MQSKKEQTGGNHHPEMFTEVANWMVEMLQDGESNNKYLYKSVTDEIIDELAIQPLSADPYQSCRIPDFLVRLLGINIAL